MDQINNLRRLGAAFLAIVLLVLVQSCILEGEPSEETGPQIVNEKGKPVAGAKVYITPINNIPYKGSGSETGLLGSGSETTFNGSGSETAITNENGRYSLDGLKAGNYNIEAYKDGKASFRNSVEINDDATYKKQKDTLRTPGVLTGKVMLLEDDDVRTVFVFLLGTIHLTVTDENGVFSFPDLGKGEYHLRILTTLDDYEVWDSGPLDIKTGKTLDLGEIYLEHKTELNIKTLNLVGSGQTLYEFGDPVYGIDYYQGNFFQVNLSGGFSRYDQEGKLINSWNMENNLNDLYRSNVLKVLGEDSVLIVDENYNFNLHNFKGELYSTFSLNLDFYNMSFIDGRIFLSDIAQPVIHVYNLKGEKLDSYSKRDSVKNEFGSLWGSMYVDKNIFVIDKFGVNSESFITKFDLDFNYVSNLRLYFQNTEWIRHCSTEKAIFVLGSEIGYLLDTDLNVMKKIKLFDGVSTNTKTHTGCALTDSKNVAVFDESGHVEMFKFE